MEATENTLSASLEDYLKTILHLIQEGPVARAKDISQHLKVKSSSVTGALKALSERKLVNYEPYGFVTLTPPGTEIAQKVLRRHEALKDFFVNVLTIANDEAEEAACRMEHGVSKSIVDRLLDLASFVETCPRAGTKWVQGLGYQCKETAHSGESCERCLSQCLDDVRSSLKKETSETMITTLNELKPGEKGHIEKVAGAGPIRRRIADMGVIRGSLVEVVRVAPLGDPIDVRIKGYHLSLRKDEAASITVKKME